MGGHNVDWYPFAILYAVFILKHCVADFWFQTSWMAAGKERPTNWLAPLSAHCAIHAVLTGAIAMVVAPRLWWLAIADFFIHAAIDRCKGLIGRRFALTPFTDARWWRLFGLDQALHELTHLVYVLVLLRP